MNRKNTAVVGLGLAAVLFVAVNVLAQAGLKGARLDLTADHLYTLSPGTQKVIGSLREPVTLRLFFSDTLAAEVPAMRTYGTRVRELLEEYAGRANGKIRLEIIDPEPYSDAEDRAVAAGVQGVPLDRTSGRQFYFGLVGTNSTDKQEVIPFFQQDREAFLEYDLTKLVHALGDPKKPMVGVLTDIPLEYGPGGMMMAMRGQSQPYAILTQLRSFFDVRMLDPSAPSIGEDVRVLVVARPRGLSDAAQYAIDQFVMRGGHALFLVDPYAESQTNPQTGMPDPGPEKAAALPRLFDAWGIAMAADRFVADPRLALNVSAGDQARRRTVPYPAWLSVGEANQDRGDVVTAQIGAVNIASAGGLSKKDGAAITLTPLITSSPAAQLVPTTEMRARPEPEKLMAMLKAGDGATQVLAARVTGPLKSAFPDGPPPVKEGEAAPPAGQHLAESRQPANLIIIADSDLIEDRFWVEDQSMFGQRVLAPFAGNGDLIVNAVENLTGSSDLIGLRGRAGSTRPFTLVEDLRRSAGQQMLAREQELQTRLKEAERQLADLQGKQKAGASAMLSAEETQAIERFRQEAVRIRKELRDVQHSLNKDIEGLSAAVKAVNIVAVPLVVALAAAGVAGVRSRRRQRRSDPE
ncbi:ABC transporter [Azospirillum sp. RWY-5-1]|uniref:ABC transporter n=1 Tax=Azospirillum oleiclasticum TaxID=2735135 RepID=A0ABX2TJM0_9PROT|nr:Gldg family protein [Azospirillum oleiclasticum]NYZ15073.1 ABC transporter [Azospirillum oleiclasticum]NYZ22835.1 ABC transporter [Azospirillum oleiclasticum]